MRRLCVTDLLAAASSPRLATPIVLLVLGGCSHDAIRYIPETDRTALQVQDRLGGNGSGAPAGKISVEEMLRRARTGDAITNAAPSRILIKFQGQQVQPDQTQRDTLRRFAADAPGGPGQLTVSSRPGASMTRGRRSSGNVAP